MLTPSPRKDEVDLSAEFLINPRPCGVARVVKEAWQHLPSNLKVAAQDMVKDLMLGSGGPLRVTTLCSGTDGAIDTMKDCFVFCVRMMVMLTLTVDE